MMKNTPFKMEINLGDIISKDSVSLFTTKLHKFLPKMLLKLNNE